MNPTKHENRIMTQDSASGSAAIAVVEDFDKHYLSGFGTLPPGWNKVMKEFCKKVKAAARKSETAMYPYIITLFTRISLEINKGAEKVLTFYATGETGCGTLRPFQGKELRPDMIAKFTTVAEARKLVKSHGNIRGSSFQALWTDVRSAAEVKRLGRKPPSAQAISYVHLLPCALPNLAGMLLLSCDSDGFHLYWSDTSSIIRSHCYHFADPASWPILFAYVHTVCNPKEGLLAWDPTMTLCSQDSSQSSELRRTLWEIRTSKRTFRAHLHWAKTHHSSLTCIFEDELSKRMIKDHWYDVARRFRENELLEKVKGVSGMVQVDFAEDVKDEHGFDLQTSPVHSGREPTLDIEGRRVPGRKKQRCVLKSIGIPLSSSKSVAQSLRGIYDSLQGHQIALREKGILHRDVSRGNILLEPVHHDTVFEEFSGSVPIDKVLDKNAEDAGDAGMLIDLGNAADLNEKDVGDVLTERTGTPMYVAIAVSKGRIRKLAISRTDFPTLSDEAERKYRDAYGDNILNNYPEEVNRTPKLKNPRNVQEPAYQHSAHHDVESIFWVTFYELLVAWPENNDEELSFSAIRMILRFKRHTFVDASVDDREGVLTMALDSFENMLHPRLKKLGGMLFKMAQYIYAEWQYWENDGLPVDHCHEALKRLLLEGILLLNDDPIALKDVERGRGIPDDFFKYASTYCAGALHKQDSPLKNQSTKRSSAAVDNTDGAEDNMLEPTRKTRKTSLLTLRRSLRLQKKDP